MKFVSELNLSLINLNSAGQCWINGGSNVSLPCPVQLGQPWCLVVP